MAEITASSVKELREKSGAGMMDCKQALSEAGGDMDEVVAMIPGVMSVGRMMGCSSVLVEGRKGWERVLAALGFEHFSTTLRKDL